MIKGLFHWSIERSLKRICWQRVHIYKRVANTIQSNLVSGINSTYLNPSQHYLFHANNGNTTLSIVHFEQTNAQKQPFRGVLEKRCSENRQHIYRRTPMPKCDFLYICCIFSEHLFKRTPLNDCFWNASWEFLFESVIDEPSSIFIKIRLHLFQTKNKTGWEK